VTVRCSVCAGDLTEIVDRQRALQAAKRVGSFPFVCPHCRGFFSLEIEGEAMTLILERNGGSEMLRTPNLLDALWEDAEIREGLLRGMLDEDEEDE
jgi:hypothetical protein